MDKIIVTVLGGGLIGGIYWFFLLKRARSIAVGASRELTITVEGGYTPDRIEMKKGTPVTLNFLRTDPSSCLEEVVIPGFHVRKQLPLGEEVKVTLHPEESGRYPFSCGMNMYHGELIVTE